MLSAHQGDYAFTAQPHACPSKQGLEPIIENMKVCLGTFGDVNSHSGWGTCLALEGLATLPSTKKIFIGCGAWPLPWRRWAELRYI